MQRSKRYYELMDLGYEGALRLAGAQVLAYEAFGSYQGDWWAKVILPDGQEGYIHDYYGSCSGCDSWCSEFDFNHDPDDVLEAKIKDFGKNYFDQLMTREQALKEAAEHASWDIEADAVLKWLKEH